jgi:hypothetical protein
MLALTVLNYKPEKRDEFIKGVLKKGTSWVPEGAKLLVWWAFQVLLLSLCWSR